jgi:transposase-like protein
MALSQSAVSELLEVLRSREAVDVIRESVRMVMQELIEAEATQVVGAARYERTDTRVTERNAYRPRTVSTKAGDIDLRIPKLRKGSFFPLILQPRRRIDQALSAVVMQGLRGRGVHPGRGRPGRRVGDRLGHLQVRGVPDLRRPGRGRHRLPHP